MWISRGHAWWPDMQHAGAPDAQEVLTAMEGLNKTHTAGSPGRMKLLYQCTSRTTQCFPVEGHDLVTNPIPMGFHSVFQFMSYVFSWLVQKKKRLHWNPLGGPDCFHVRSWSPWSRRLAWQLRCDGIASRGLTARCCVLKIVCHHLPAFGQGGMWLGFESWNLEVLLLKHLKISPNGVRSPHPRCTKVYPTVPMSQGPTWCQTCSRTAALAMALGPMPRPMPSRQEMLVYAWNRTQRMGCGSLVWRPGFWHVLTTCWVYRGGLPGILTCGVGWGGVGCVNVGVHVYTWYAAGVSCAKVLRLGWGGVGWGVSTFVFICKHGTLLVCHVQTYHAIAVSCLIVHRSATRCTKSNSTKQHSWQIVSNGNAVNYR